MSYQYHDRGGPQDYDYDHAPSGPRRPPPPRDPYGPDPRRPRGPPPVRPPHPSAGAPRGPGGYPVRPPPPQQYSRPPPQMMDYDESMYNGSAYGGADFEQSDSWPLPAPAPAFAQQSRPRSPGSPGGSRGPRRPPQRPQRPDYQEPILDQPRSAGRPPPDPRAYQRGPPPPRSHHGDGQWTGEGYSSPPQNFPPQHFQRPPREPPQSAIPDFPTPQQQQALYRQPNPRPPLGPPPSARRGPASYYPEIAPVHPIVEETDSLRGSIRNASMVPSHSSYASSNAIPIGIPDYYLEEQRHSGIPPQPRNEPEDDFPESPVDPSVDGRDSRNTERTGPSPDPAAFVRQASLGKKSKPTLTTVKSGDRLRREPMPEGLDSMPSQQQQQQRVLVGGEPMDAAPGTGKEQWPPRVGPPPRPSYEDDEDYRSDGYDIAAEPAGLSVAGASKSHPDDDALQKPSTRRRSSDVLSSGTGLLDPSSSSDDSEKDLEQQQAPRPRELNRAPSKELLSVSAALSKEQQHRPRSRSPLAPEVDPRVERIVGGLEKGGTITSEEASQLKADQATSLPATSGGLSEKDGAGARRPRPPKLDVDKVRDAEARGSLTSLPDLIRRATKVASNLDRGKTASRLGMGFFENSSQSDVERMKALDRANRRSNASGMSDMLASFPPPRNGEHGGMRRWSSNLRHNALPSTSDAGEGGKGKKGRRCCGMPLWLFVVLLILLLLLVAAAVIVPVVLVVIPNQDGGSNLAKRCAEELSCRHGGVAIADAGPGSNSSPATTNNPSGENNGNGNAAGGECRCLCISGYTGQTCGTYAPAACTTATIGETADATLGDSIPSVLDQASNFGLQLDGQKLLGLFSRNDLSCSAQNALVSFSVPRNVRRQDPSPSAVQTAPPGARTSNGLLVAPAASTSPSSLSPTPTSSSPTPSPSSSSSPRQSSFAAAVVLYLFQSTSSLDAAGTAQANLQEYFAGTGGHGMEDVVLLGGGWRALMGRLELRAGNGTVVTGSGEE